MKQEEILARFGPREAMEYDVVVVGGGPVGLATAIRLKQLAAAKGSDVSGRHVLALPLAYYFWTVVSKH